MDQKTKDRLFTLGLDIPPEVSIKGASAIDQWASQAIAAALTAGGPKADVVASEMAAEDFGGTAPRESGAADAGPAVAATAPAVEGSSGGGTFAALLDDAGLDLVEILGKINETAIELGELAVSEGPDAVYARLGELPAWPLFEVWAESAIDAAAPEPEAHPDPNAWQRGPATDPPAAVPQPDGDPGEPEPDPGGAESPVPDPEPEPLAAEAVVGFHHVERIDETLVELTARTATLENQLGVLQAELLAYGVRTDEVLGKHGARLDRVETRGDDIGERIDATLETYAGQIGALAARIDVLEALPETFPEDGDGETLEPDDGSEAIET